MHGAATVLLCFFFCGYGLKSVKGRVWRWQRSKHCRGVCTAGALAGAPAPGSHGPGHLLPTHLAAVFICKCCAMAVNGFGLGVTLRAGLRAASVIERPVGRTMCVWYCCCHVCRAPGRLAPPGCDRNPCLQHSMLCSLGDSGACWCVRAGVRSKAGGRAGGTDPNAGRAAHPPPALSRGIVSTHTMRVSRPGPSNTTHHSTALYSCGGLVSAHPPTPTPKQFWQLLSRARAPSLRQPGMHTSPNKQGPSCNFLHCSTRCPLLGTRARVSGLLF